MSSSTEGELESRVRSLTESLIQKQTMLESLSTEKNSLTLQLERLQVSCILYINKICLSACLSVIYWYHVIVSVVRRHLVSWQKLKYYLWNLITRFETTIPGGMVNRKRATNKGFLVSGQFISSVREVIEHKCLDFRN